MPSFHHSAQVDATLEAVTAFHHDPRNFRKLTPMPVKVHRYEWSGPTGRVDFTLWFGPFPVRWEASLESHPTGFIDRQDRGPLGSWVHVHSFTSVTSGVTLIDDKIEYSYQSGWRGWLSRLAFAPPALRILFAYRIWRTRRALKKPDAF